MTQKRRNELSQLLVEFNAMDKELKELKEKVEIVKEEIKQQMAKEKIEEFMFEDMIATMKTVEGNRFDSKELEKTHPKIYKQYLVPTSSVRLTVKENKKAKVLAKI